MLDNSVDVSDVFVSLYSLSFKIVTREPPTATTNLTQNSTTRVIIS